MSSKKNQSTRGRGRPETANQLRIVPLPHANPDPQKLGRALLALALHQAADDAPEHVSDVDTTSSEEAR